MAARKDIHRPSVINPADYEYVAIEVMTVESFGDCEALLAERAKIAAHMERTGGKYSSHAHKGNCHVCGAHAVYTALFYHAATNTYIRTGMDCAAKMDACDEALFRRIKDEVTASLQAKTGKLKAKGILAEAGLTKCWELYEANWLDPELAKEGWTIERESEDDHYNCERIDKHTNDTVCLKCLNYGYYTGKLRKVKHYDMTFEYRTIIDIVGKLVKYGSVSEKQMWFLSKLLKDHDTKNEREAKYAAEKAKAADCPTGRQTVEVTVIKTEWKESEFGSSLKMLVKADAGFMLWGSVPSAQHDVKKGDRLKLTATITPSEKDAKFGFFKRPIAAAV